MLSDHDESQPTTEEVDRLVEAVIADPSISGSRKPLRLLRHLISVQRNRHPPGDDWRLVVIWFRCKYDRTPSDDEQHDQAWEEGLVAGLYHESPIPPQKFDAIHFRLGYQEGKEEAKNAVSGDWGNYAGKATADELVRLLREYFYALHSDTRLIIQIKRCEPKIVPRQQASEPRFITPQKRIAIVPQDKQWRAHLKKILELETTQDLDGMQPADADEIQKALRNFNDDPIIKECAQPITFPPFLEHWYRSFHEAFLDPTQERAINAGIDGQPIQIAFAATLLGAAAMLYYLKDVRKLNIKLICSGTTHTVTLFDRFRQFDPGFPPDVLIGGTGMISGLQRDRSRHGYEVLALLNRPRFFLVSPILGETRPGWITAAPPELIRVPITVPTGYPNSLSLHAKRLHALKWAVAGVHNKEPSYLLPGLKENRGAKKAERYALTYSLHARLAQQLKAGTLIRLPRGVTDSYQTFVEAGQPVMKRRNLATALASALTTAWQNLKDSRELRQQVIQAMLEDPHFVEATAAASGWHKR